MRLSADEKALLKAAIQAGYFIKQRPPAKPPNGK